MNYIGRPAWRNQWLAITVAVVLILLSIFMLPGVAATKDPGGAIIVGLLSAAALVIVLAILYRRYLWKFSITPETIESRQGIVARDLRSIRVKDLRNVNVRQSFFQRIFGIGHLEFSSAGGSGIEVTFYGITKPLEIKQQVQALQGGL